MLYQVHLARVGSDLAMLAYQLRMISFLLETSHVEYVNINFDLEIDHFDIFQFLDSVFFSLNYDMFYFVNNGK